jgi:hypothetical protein
MRKKEDLKRSEMKKERHRGMCQYCVVVAPFFPGLIFVFLIKEE